MRPTGSGAKSLSTLEAWKKPARGLPDGAGGGWRERPLVAGQIMPPLARSVWPLIQPSGPASKEDGGDVLRRAEALQRVHPRRALNQLVRFAVEERSVAVRPDAAASTVMLRPRITLAVIAVKVSTAALVAA